MHTGPDEEGRQVPRHPGPGWWACQDVVRTSCPSVWPPPSHLCSGSQRPFTETNWKELQPTKLHLEKANSYSFFYPLPSYAVIFSLRKLKKMTLHEKTFAIALWVPGLRTHRGPYIVVAMKDCHSLCTHLPHSKMWGLRWWQCPVEERS